MQELFMHIHLLVCVCVCVCVCVYCVVYMCIVANGNFNQ